METRQEEGKEQISPSVDAYERMCAAVYAYRFGTIGFLDMLTRFEEILGIEPPQTNSQPDADREE